MKHLVYVLADGNYFLSHRLELANCAIKNKYRVSLLCPDFKEKSILNNIKYVQSTFDRAGINFFKELFSLIKLNFVLYKIKPDIVHAIALKPAIYVSFFNYIFFKKQIVASLNGFGYIFTSKSIKAKILKIIVKTLLKIFLNNKYLTIVVQNQDDYLDCKKLFKSAKVLLIKGSGVDCNVFNINKNKAQTPFTYLLLSRMLYSKGVLEYIEAIKLFNLHFKNKTDARFFLVGSQDLKNPQTVLNSTLKKWHNDGIVEWFEFDKNVKKFYDIAHVSVLPSYREGLPKSLLESMASGLFIITTNVRGCKDLVRNNLNGFLIKHQDSYDLFQAMLKIYNNFELIEKTKNINRQEVINNYEINLINNQFIKIYNNNCS